LRRAAARRGAGGFAPGPPAYLTQEERPDGQIGWQ